MKLSEKIYNCRKKLGKSQAALAEDIGVSRQAISKWETGDAEPEIGKLKLLAAAFGVTVDWMLSEDEEMPEEKVKVNTESTTNVNTNGNSNWVESVPGVIGKLLRKYGWLFGVHIAIGGGIFVIFSLIVHFALKSMSSMVGKNVDSMFSGFEDEMIGGFGNGFGSSVFQSTKDTMTDMASNNPVSIIGIAMLVIGVIMIIVGVTLAVILKRKAKIDN